VPLRRATVKKQKKAAAKKKAPEKDQAWFESKVAELKTALEKLPADRQKQLERELKQEKP
jgi:hypothetical protein